MWFFFSLGCIIDSFSFLMFPNWRSTNSKEKLVVFSCFNFFLTKQKYFLKHLDLPKLCLLVLLPQEQYVPSAQ